MRSLCFAFVISFSLIASIPQSASAEGGMAARVEQLEAQVAALEELLQFVRVDAAQINGLAGPHWIFEGINVHVRSGTGSTHGPCSDDPVCARRRGLGNLIVGYNEGIPSRARLRRGTHNLVVGEDHQYRGSGGFVAGHQNALWGQSASVTGGERNLAIGENTSICGGKFNFAAGMNSSVGGGLENGASGDFSSVSGGTGNVASGESSVVGGGFRNEASGRNASVSGGGGNFASAPLSAISGGRNNAADALAASVSGGNDRDAPDPDNWAAGSLLEPN